MCACVGVLSLLWMILSLPESRLGNGFYGPVFDLVIKSFVLVPDREQVSVSICLFFTPIISSQVL